MNAQTAQTVEQIASTILGNPALASVFEGTLFLEGASARQVARIETALIDHLQCGVIVSPFVKTPGAFAIDFV